MVVPVLDVFEHSRAQFGLAGEARVLQPLAGQDPEPDLDLIEPRGMRRREVKVEPVPMPAVPGNHGRAEVGVEVVQDDVDGASWIAARQLIEVGQEVCTFAGGVHPAEDLARLDLEGSEQADGAVPDVAVLEATRAPRSGLLDGCRALQGLDLGLLVYAQEHTPVRGALRVEPHDVHHLLVEAWILAVEPHPEAMRLEVHLGEQLPHGRGPQRLEPRLLCRSVKARDAPLAPGNAEVGGCLAGHGDDPVSCLRRDPGRPTRTRLVRQRQQATSREPSPPGDDRLPRHPDLPCDLRVPQTLVGQENNLSPLQDPPLHRCHTLDGLQEIHLLRVERDPHRWFKLRHEDHLRGGSMARDWGGRQDCLRTYRWLY